MRNEAFVYLIIYQFNILTLLNVFLFYPICLLQKVSKPITNSGATEKQREHTNVTVPHVMGLQEQNIFEYWEENVAYLKEMK